MKEPVERFKNRFEQAEETISELEDTKCKEQKRKTLKSEQNMRIFGTPQRPMYVMYWSRRRENKRVESLFEEKNAPELPKI